VFRGTEVAGAGVEDPATTIVWYWRWADGLPADTDM